MYPPRKNQSPFALFCLILFLLSGCIGDPTTVSPCEGANCTDPDAGHGDFEPDANGDFEPDANGDSDVPDANGDSDEPDADSDSDEPDVECLVPTFYTLAEAVADENCSEIYIESGHTETVTESDSPLQIQQDLLIYGGEGEHHQRSTIEVSSEGLFEIDGGASLTLKNLEIRQLDAALTNSAFTAHSGAELTLEEVEIIGLTLRNQPVIHAQNSTVHLIDSTLRDTTSLGNGPVAIDCAQSSITLEDSAIESNTARYLALHLQVGGPFYGAVALDNCDLTLTRSEIRGNRLRGDNISLNSDTTLLARGAAISGTNQSSVDILDESEVSDNEIFGHFTLEEPIDINIDAKGAGISLFDSSLTLERSTISENSINFSVSAAGENQGTNDSSIQALGAGLYLSFDEDENFEILIDRSTISGNLIDFALEDAFAPIDRGAGAGLAIFSHTPIPTAPLHMVNSTVSSNQISGIQDAEAAGILMKTNLEDTILTPEVGDLYAQIRYSTIVENSLGSAGDDDDSPGAGFVVHNMEASVRPLISLIGVLFQNNTNGSGSADCGGRAWISQVPLLGSSHNLCSEDSEDRCQDAFSTSDMTVTGPHPIEGGDAELSELERRSAWPTAVHTPEDASEAIDAGQVATCSGIDGSSLTEDQRGLTRPINNQCDIGSVEVQ